MQRKSLTCAARQVLWRLDNVIDGGSREIKLTTSAFGRQRSLPMRRPLTSAKAECHSLTYGPLVKFNLSYVAKNELAINLK